MMVIILKDCSLSTRNMRSIYSVLSEIRYVKFEAYFALFSRVGSIPEVDFETFVIFVKIKNRWRLKTRFFERAH